MKPGSCVFLLSMNSRKHHIEIKNCRDFADFLYSERKQQGLRQQAFFAVSQSQISKIEANKSGFRFEDALEIVTRLGFVVVLKKQR